MTDDTTGRYEWERIIRRCDLPATTKLVAMMAATYANSDGSRVFPGATRLAAVCNLSERAVRGALKQLRDVGLLVRETRGGMRGTKAFADVYRLAVPADLLERVDLLGPDEEGFPNRHHVPVGGVPNRHETASQPANDAPQPANDDIPNRHHVPPTNTTTTHRPTHNQPRTGGLVTQPQNAHAREAKIISLVGRAAR